MDLTDPIFVHNLILLVMAVIFAVVTGEVIVQIIEFVIETLYGD